MARPGGLRKVQAYIHNRAAYMKYGCGAAVTALSVMVYLGSRDFGSASLQDRYRLLCDAFTIPGLLMILSGALVWVSNEGAFHGVSYCVRLAVFALIPGRRKDGYEKFSDYVERKSQKRIGGYSFLFWSGLMTMGLALVFFMLYSL